MLVAIGDLARGRLGDRAHVVLRVRLEMLLPHKRDNADCDERRHGRDEGERQRHAGGVGQATPTEAAVMPFLFLFFELVGLFVERLYGRYGIFCFL